MKFAGLPGAQGYRMPPEWAPHRATWIAFPHHRTDWPGKLAALPWTFAEMTRVLSQKESVCVLVKDRGERARAESTFERAGARMEAVEFVQAQTNRSWTRDSMPLWVQAARGTRKIAVNFRFDGWARYRDHKADDAAGMKVAEASVRAERAESLHMPLLPDGTRAVLEGGSIDVDEWGTLLTTRECLLTSPRARYGKLGQEFCERLLSDALGVKKVLWLDSGIVGDDTSGHVDDFARFAPGGRVLVSVERRKGDANFAPLQKAKKALAQMTNAKGQRLEVIELPMPAPVFYGDMRLPASYANYYIANVGVLVPVFNDEMDREALNIIAAAYPDRPVIPIYARDLVLGLGTLHCSTMQEPR
jgi:agmatine deiminase